MLTGGDTQGAVVIANTAIVASSARPAHPGEYISIFCTGLGAVTNQPATGAAPSQLSQTIATPSVKIGTLDAAVSFSGLAPGFVGLYQVNVQVPANAPAGRARAALDHHRRRAIQRGHLRDRAVVIYHREDRRLAAVWRRSDRASFRIQHQVGRVWRQLARAPNWKHRPPCRPE
jgi:hypothetical protein